MTTILAICAVCGAEDINHFYAGTATTDITPPPGHYCEYHGHTPLKKENIHDPLLARVVVLKDTDTTVAIIAVDLIVFSSKKVVDEIKKQWDIDHVILSATHIHSGMQPRLKDMLNGRWIKNGDPGDVVDWSTLSEDPWYASTEEKIIAAAGEAKKNLFPARIGAGKGKVDLSHNRRLVRNGKVTMLWANPSKIPTKPVDKTVGVIRIDDMSGKSRAILVHYACHPVTIMGDKKYITADFPGAMVDYIEKEAGNKCMAMFLQGASGDIDPYIMRLKGQAAFKNIQEKGATLGKEALRVAKGLKLQHSKDTSLKVKELLLSIPHRSVGGYHPKAGKASDVLISTIVIDDNIAFMTMPGEAFAQHQIDLTSKSPVDNTFLMGLAYCGKGSPFLCYVPTIQAIKDGGYGADEHTFLESGAGERMVEEAVRSIKELAKSKE